jgi:transposase
MLEFRLRKPVLIGPKGTLDIPENDEITRKLSMLYEVHCEGLSATQASEKYGFTRQHYYVLLKKFREGGAQSLANKPRGPKTNYRRTSSVVRQVIRHRFLDPDASPEVIAQKLRQAGATISIRSVQRVIEEFGVQKKTL